MLSLKSILVFIGLILSAFTINAQLCDLSSDRYKGCRGDYFEFSIPAPPTSFASITWNFGDGTFSNQKTSIISHIYDTFGRLTITVILRDKGGNTICGPDSITINIFDKPDPIIGLLSPTTQFLKWNKFEFIDNSEPGNSNAPLTQREWWFGSEGSDTTSNPVFSFSKNGTFKVYLWIADTNICVDTTSISVIVIDTTTSIDKTSDQEEFLIYPNPFNEFVRIFIPKDKAVTEIELLNLSGRSLSVRREQLENNLVLFRDELPRGMYVLKIVADKVYVFKIVAE